jgi:integrase
MTIPEDVRDKFGKRHVRRTTGTDSQKKASRLANIWADELWLQVERARSPDWDYHIIKAGVLEMKDKGLSPDEIDDVALEIFYDEPEKYDAYERATNKTVVLKDHLEGYLAWCVGKGNLPKTIKIKRQMLGQFCRRFDRLERVTESEIIRWTAERNVKGATQKSMRAFSRDFFNYLGQKVLLKKLDNSVLDNLVTKAINSEHKDIISGEGFKQALEATKCKDGMMLLAHTGRRSMAIANLTCEDVVTSSDGVRCFRIRVDKGRRPDTHKPQLIPIHSKLSGIVDRLLRDSVDGHLLPLAGATYEGRSEALQGHVKEGGLITSHQFRTSVITMLHNSPTQLSDKTIFAVVGHSLGKSVHMNSYMKGFNPSVLVATVEAIEWDGWDYLG